MPEPINENFHEGGVNNGVLTLAATEKFKGLRSKTFAPFRVLLNSTCTVQVEFFYIRIGSGIINPFSGIMG